MNKRVVFKPYNPDQLSLLPPSLEELIPENHVVRVVDQVVDSIDLDSILKKYKGGGTSSYHPRLLLKVIIYGYISNIYSSRKIEEAVCANIHFMWLAGMKRPDHNTINRFRSDRLKGVLKEIFSQVVRLMVESNLVSLKTIYVDGTKLEANANKYTFVWGKSIKRYKQSIARQLEELWNYAEGVAAEELKDNRPSTFEAIDADQVSQTIDKINGALKDKKIDSKIKQKLNYGKRNWPSKVKQYKAQEDILGDRNSYSKTDPDATFMRMKDDHMRNGQLKAGYNWQISTSDQFIVNYDIYHNATDTLTLPSHLDNFIGLYDEAPETVVADSGYGSEENYEYLEDKGITGYVKYNYFHLEQKQKGKPSKKKPFARQYLHYDKVNDVYICPMGQRMEFKYYANRKTKSGYQQKSSVYEAKNCNNCPLRGACHKSKTNRIIHVNHRLEKHKKQAKTLLLSEQGKKHRSQRPVDVEAVFGNIKQNKAFTRFRLRGKEKVQIEAGLVALAHNLAKMAN